MAEGAGEQVEYRVVEDPAHRFAIEQTRMTLEAGWLGKIFGTSTNAPTNIAGFVVCILTITIIGTGLLLVPSTIPAMDFMNVVVPIITLVLGYLFGKTT